VQAIRARRAAEKGYPRTGRLPVRGAGALLSEIAFCASCGGKMHTLVCGEGAGRQRYYRCGERRKFGSDACDAKMVQARVIEDRLFGIISKLGLPSTLRDAVRQVAQDRLARPVTPNGQDAATLKKQLDRLKDLYEFGDIPKEEYLQKREKIHRQLVQAVDTAPEVLDVDRSAVLLANLGALLDGATATQRRAFLQQIISQVWIEKGAIVAIRPTPNFRLFIETVRDMAAGNSSPVEIAIDTRAAV
jgi:hypothetical protein